jgi:hypothetical protein
MEDGLIIIDPNKIRARIAALHAKAARLEAILVDLTTDDFVVEAKPEPANGNGKPGRPKIESPLLPLRVKLTNFILAQHAEFTSKQLWEASGESIDDRTRYHAVVRSLVEDGILEVALQPLGRRIGTYRKGTKV